MTTAATSDPARRSPAYLRTICRRFSQSLVDALSGRSTESDCHGPCYPCRIRSAPARSTPRMNWGDVKWGDVTASVLRLAMSEVENWVRIVYSLGLVTYRVRRDRSTEDRSDHH
jgi:hypothetical protein